MGMIELFTIIAAAVIIGVLFVWGLKTFTPDTAKPPEYIYKIIWGVVVLVIFVTLLHAFGLLGVDPQVPRIR